jgi:hypothetical protein
MVPTVALEALVLLGLHLAAMPHTGGEDDDDVTPLA